MTKIPLWIAMLVAIPLASPALAQDGSRMIEQMERADSNGDGAVSRAELLTYRADQFDRIDRNDDGILNNSDMPPIARIRERIQAQLAAFDRNGDGNITRSEFTRGPTVVFDRADTNGDGLVTRAEILAARRAS